MRKKILMVMLVLVMLIFAGCKGFNFNKDPKENQATAEKRIYVGTKGLTVNMMKNLPPDEMYAGNKLQVVAEIRNEGTYKIKGGEAFFYLSGYDPAIIPIQGEPVYFLNEIEGKSEYLLEGGYDTVRFESNDVNLPPGTDNYRPRLVLTGCYKYETKANPVICIDPNKQNPALSERGACTVQDVSTGGGQGAPVEVSRVGVDSTIDKAFFRIEIQNSGGGQVINSNSARNECPFGLEYDDLDVVTYTVFLSGAGNGECSPQIGGLNQVKLSEGRATITCKFDIPQANKLAYSTPLQINLFYGYTESVYKDVNIISVGR